MKLRPHPPAGAGRHERHGQPCCQHQSLPLPPPTTPAHPQLGVFQFFLCWFAVYVIKGDQGGAYAPGADAGAGLSLRGQGAAGLTSSVRKVRPGRAATRRRRPPQAVSLTCCCCRSRLPRALPPLADRSP